MLLEPELHKFEERLLEYHVNIPVRKWEVDREEYDLTQELRAS